MIRYVDFYIPHLYLFIEIDGSYWHKDTKDLDKKKDLLAKKYGFNTLRISDIEDIKKVYQNSLIWYNINILNNKFNN